MEEFLRSTGKVLTVDAVRYLFLRLSLSLPCADSLLLAIEYRVVRMLLYLVYTLREKPLVYQYTEVRFLSFPPFVFFSASARY